jgi:hypothetical protein
VLYVAREDDPSNHHGALFRLHLSVFALAPESLVFVRSGAFNPAIFRVIYVRHLRERWQVDPAVFLSLIDLATGGSDRTIVDDWGDEAYAPRRILTATLKTIVSVRRKEARRKERQQARRR